MKTLVSQKILLISIAVLVAFSGATYGPYILKKKAFEAKVAAAEAGDILLQYNVSVAYLYGTGGAKKNHEEAIKWLKKAAESNNLDAQFNIAEMYFTGKVVEQNYEEAAKYYKMAVEQGFEEARYKLGLLYNIGKGVPQDSVISYMWISLAANTGHARAREIEKVVLQKITSRQQKEGDILASQCKLLEYKGCGYPDYEIKLAPSEVEIDEEDANPEG